MTRPLRLTYIPLISTMLLLASAIFAFTLIGSSATSAAQATITPSPTPIGGGHGQIVFIAGEYTDQQNFEIYLMNADGSHLQKITDVSASPAWSPDGMQIAFTSWKGIDLMNADGTSHRRLTNGNLSDPTWSPDGQKIAFTEYNNGIASIYVVNTDGSEQRQLTVPEAVRNTYPLAWSPDGEQIAFTLHPEDGIPEVYTVDVTNGEIHNVSDSPAWDMYPSWSPDGEQFAFISNRNGGFEIYAMNVDGSNLYRVSHTHVSDREPFVWSPDSAKIAYCDELGDIYDMNADGSDTRNLTSDLSYSFDPMWSPDGTQIVFASVQNELYDIFVMNADGSDIRNLTNAPADNEYPLWRP